MWNRTSFIVSETFNANDCAALQRGLQSRFRFSVKHPSCVDFDVKGKFITIYSVGKINEISDYFNGFCEALKLR